jgi:cell division septation protein DedD
VSALGERPATRTVCPHCGAGLGAEQDWCLECGAAVKIRIRAAPDWRVPVAIVAGVVTVVAAGLVLALVALSNSANPSISSTPAVGSSRPAATTPAAAATTRTTATTTRTTAASTTATTAPPTTTIASWPPGVTGFTVVLGVIPAKSGATASATKLAAAGIPVGVLDSSDYSSMHPGDWIVFSGTYTTRAQADTAASQLKAKGQAGAYAFSVVPAA